MMLAEYIALFVLVTTTGAGLPGPGDASLIAAGTLAGRRAGSMLASCWPYPVQPGCSVR